MPMIKNMLAKIYLFFKLTNSIIGFVKKKVIKKPTIGSSIYIGDLKKSSGVSMFIKR